MGRNVLASEQDDCAGATLRTRNVDSKIRQDLL